MSFRPHIVSAQRTEAKDLLLISTPGNSGPNPQNPRGALVVREISRLAQQRGIPLRQHIIDYESHVAHKIRTQLDNLDIGKTRVIIAAGDGSAALIMPALADVQIEVLMAPGGTINVLAKQLGSTTTESWNKFITGNGSLRTIRLRELDISGVNTGHIAQANWINFCNVGLGARFLDAYDSKDRARSATANVLRASIELAPKVVFSSTKFCDFAAVANPLYGPFMNLGFQNDHLSNPEFGVMRLGPEPGFSAAWKFTALQLLMRDPIRNWYWSDMIPAFFDYFPKHREIRSLAKGFKPVMSSGGVHEVSFPVKAGEQIYWHTDGSPKHYTFREPDTVMVKRSTLPGVVSLFCTA